MLSNLNLLTPQEQPGPASVGNPPFTRLRVAALSSTVQPRSVWDISSPATEHFTARTPPGTLALLEYNKVEL